MDYLGGRKFIMGILIAAAGVAVEVLGKNGLSANMAGLLIGIYAAFNTANAIITSKAVTAQESEPVAAPVPKIDTQELEAKLVPIVNVIAQQLQALNDNQIRQEKALQTVQESQLTTQKVLLSSRQ